jgi:hypothetical protein
LRPFCIFFFLFRLTLTNGVMRHWKVGYKVEAEHLEAT